MCGLSILPSVDIQKASDWRVGWNIGWCVCFGATMAGGLGGVLSAFRGYDLLSASIPSAFQITSQPPAVSDTLRFYPCFGIFYAVGNLYSRAWGAFLCCIVIFFRS